jgi:type II secretory pathway predicted ATPase ExeA
MLITDINSIFEPQQLPDGQAVQQLIHTSCLKKVTKIAHKLITTPTPPQFHAVTGEAGSGLTVMAAQITSLAKPRAYTGGTTGILGVQLIRGDDTSSIELGKTFLEALEEFPRFSKTGRTRRTMFTVLQNTLKGNAVDLILIDNAHNLTIAALDYLIQICELCPCSAILFGYPSLKKTLQSSPTAWSHFQRQTTQIEKFSSAEFLDIILPQIVCSRWLYNKDSGQDREMGLLLHEKTSTFRNLMTTLKQASEHAANDNSPKIKIAHIRKVVGHKKSPVTPPSPPANYSQAEEHSDRKRSARQSKRANP